MLDPKKISKIGIGTWGIGGYMERDENVDKNRQIDAMIYMLANGWNFVEANAWYSQGASVELLAKAFKESGIRREDLFICQAIYLKDGKDLPESKLELDQVFELFQTDYVDTLQFSQGSFLRSTFEEITSWIDTLLADQKIRYTSITNADLALLKRYYEKYQDNLFSHEVIFNFEIRMNEELGIIPYGEENKIKTVVYQPIRRGRTAARNWPLLVELSNKYHVSQNQIIMSWIISKGYLPLTKSESKSHIDEHIAAINLQMENSDLEKLNNFQVPNYTAPTIDWNKSGVGITIDQLANEFDQIYKV